MFVNFDCLAFVRLDERERNESHFSIAGRSVLLRLRDVLSVDNFRLDLLPEIQGPQGFDCRASVRREVRLGYRNALDLRARDLFDAAQLQRTPRRNPKHKATTRINSIRP